MRKLGPFVVAAIVVACAGVSVLRPRAADAHCDTMDGPVVMAAERALEKGDATPVLKWVRPEHEADVRASFAQTLAVRKLGPEAADLADRYFFETLVRLHRAGEGAPYTGLKPAGSPVGRAVGAADRALEAGSAEELIALVTEQVEHGIRARFERALHAKQRADESVEAGRRFVHAYVEFVHYAERLYGDAVSEPLHAAEGAGRDDTHHD